jgi:hypothetical protein
VRGGDGLSGLHEVRIAAQAVDLLAADPRILQFALKLMF